MTVPEALEGNQCLGGEKMGRTPGTPAVSGKKSEAEKCFCFPKCI
jgi:hypothetical protein